MTADPSFSKLSPSTSEDTISEGRQPLLLDLRPTVLLRTSALSWSTSRFTASRNHDAMLSGCDECFRFHVSASPFLASPPKFIELPRHMFNLVNIGRIRI